MLASLSFSLACNPQIGFSRVEPMGFPSGSAGKEPACNVGNWVRSLGQEDALEKGKATHSSILAWRVPWTDEPEG